MDFCRVGRSRVEEVDVFQLLLVDDTLVFHKPSLYQMTYLSWLLLWFKACRVEKKFKSEYV